MKTFIVQLFIACLMTPALFSQHTVIEDNSSAVADDPQLLILEVNDNGSMDNEDGWARMWFKNSSDAINRWGFLARPHTGAVDNQNVLSSPLVMAYTGIQKFGFGRDGNLVINKQFMLPNQAGNEGQTLLTTGQTIGTPSNTSVVDWGYVDYTEKDGNINNSNFEIHEDSDDSAFLNFSNNETDGIPGFNTRWFIGADAGNANLTNTTGEMRIGWTNGTVMGAKNILTLNADDESVIFNGSGDFNGTVRASCGLLTCSDVRYKENITNISDALSKITKLNGVYFDLRNEDFPEMNFTSDKQIGVVAQDMEAQFPELVKEREDGYKMVAYDRIAPILIEAIKEQQSMIEKLQADNEVLNSKVDMLLSKQ